MLSCDEKLLADAAAKENLAGFSFCNFTVFLAIFKVVVVVDVNNLKNGRKPVKLQKESPAGCTGEGKQSKGN